MSNRDYDTNDTYDSSHDRMRPFPGLDAHAWEREAEALHRRAESQRQDALAALRILRGRNQRRRRNS